MVRACALLQLLLYALTRSTHARQDGAAGRAAAADEYMHGACDHAAALAHDLPLSRRGGCRAPCRWCPYRIIRTLTGIIRTLTGVIRTLTGLSVPLPDYPCPYRIIRALTGVIRTLTGIISTLISAEADAVRAADVTVLRRFSPCCMPVACTIEYSICRALVTHGSARLGRPLAVLHNAGGPLCPFATTERPHTQSAVPREGLQ